MRPAMLNSERSPVKPAAMAAICPFCSPVSWSKVATTPIKRPPNTSCKSGEAIERIPIPAVTFRHNTAHSSQNCFVRQATSRATFLSVTSAFCVVAVGCQPAGFQPSAGTR